MVKEKVIREKYPKVGEGNGGILEEQKEIKEKKTKKKSSKNETEWRDGKLNKHKMTQNQLRPHRIKEEIRRGMK